MKLLCIISIQLKAKYCNESMALRAHLKYDFTAKLDIGGIQVSLAGRPSLQQEGGQPLLSGLHVNTGADWEQVEYKSMLFVCNMLY